MTQGPPQRSCAKFAAVPARLSASHDRDGIFGALASATRLRRGIELLRYLESTAI
jgi:hypothetical protein